ncbi:hypothetical protein AWB70_04333 [Caballeronia cordobensis]|uniref:Uncharacterized protein n=1 Tax=Caballeronia cordobensis TaxID=1353886 RepID=A0A158I7B4_CABCO|nr:hypothetical protein [Caballeronia cordobensis]SAL52347.1 hypothetical protein AWB70_04333 [Caballeronia cordobensis]
MNVGEHSPSQIICGRDAFVADVLLYDRLVVPYPPTAEERARWSERERQWRPDLLDAKLDLLPEQMVIRVPWNEFAQERYKLRIDAAKDVSFDGQHIVTEQASVDAYHMTRMILAQDCRPQLPEGVTKVWAFGAYPSLMAYQKDHAEATNAEGQEILAMVLRHRFLVPESEGKSDDELLAQAVALAKRGDFKEKRARFHRWQEDVIEQEITSADAVAEMEELVRQLEAITRKARIDTCLKFAFMAIPAAIGLATAGAGTPLVAAGAAGLVSVASFIYFDRKPRIDAGDCDAAAMIHDVQEHFRQGSK